MIQLGNMFMYIHLLLSPNLILDLKNYRTFMRYDFVNLINMLSLYKSKRIESIVFNVKFALQQAPLHFLNSVTAMFNNIS